MGSGKRFRISLLHWNHWSVGISYTYMGEHEFSVNIHLLKLGIYIGFGKGYEEFDRE